MWADCQGRTQKTALQRVVAKDSATDFGGCGANATDDENHVLSSSTAGQSQNESKKGIFI